MLWKFCRGGESREFQRFQSWFFPPTNQMCWFLGVDGLENASKEIWTVAFASAHFLRHLRELQRSNGGGSYFQWLNGKKNENIYGRGKWTKRCLWPEEKAFCWGESSWMAGEANMVGNLKILQRILGKAEVGVFPLTGPQLAWDILVACPVVTRATSERTCRPAHRCRCFKRRSLTIALFIKKSDNQIIRNFILVGK